MEDNKALRQMLAEDIASDIRQHIQTYGVAEAFSISPKFGELMTQIASDIARVEVKKAYKKALNISPKPYPTVGWVPGPNPATVADHRRLLTQVFGRKVTLK